MVNDRPFYSCVLSVQAFEYHSYAEKAVNIII